MKHWRWIAAAAFVTLATGFAYGSVWQWTLNANSNATSDPAINWQEGMSPSSVNDSARSMMARIAEWRDDFSGLLTTSGTSTAYTVTTNQGLNAVPNDGQLIAVTMNVTNGVAPTLTADGGTTYAIQSSPGSPIGAGTLVSGSPYMMKFKLASSAWILHGFYGNSFSVPVGGMIDYFGATSPNSNFIFPSGQCISRTTFAAFFALVSTLYGVCDGSTTFGVPDFRGTIAVGKDNMNGSARGLVTTAGSNCDGATLGTQCGAQNGTIAQANLPNATLSVSITDPGHFHTIHTTTAAAGGAITVIDNFVGGTVNTSTNTTGITATTASINGGVTQTVVPIMPPSQIVNKLLRVF